jgi:D-glycero-D-manno-heptose 1,7-bisphosphate phosphatase
MPLVLLDRDGVINEDSTDFVKSVAEWHPLPGSLEAVARLKHAGYLVAVCTNQSGLARGLLDTYALDGIHAALRSALAERGAVLDGLYVCPHGPHDGCACRKPRPGLLLTAMRDLGQRPEDTRYVGDSLRDVEAALAAGCEPVLVRTGNGHASERDARCLGVTRVFDDLRRVADWLESA